MAVFKPSIELTFAPQFNLHEASYYSARRGINFYFKYLPGLRLHHFHCYQRGKY